MEDTITLIGLQIKTLRIDANLSQQELADISGISRSQISKIESGTVTGVTFNTIESILQALNKKVIVADLNTEEYQMHPIVKCAGGKTQLLDEIIKHMPSKFNRYFEPFFGGGALLFKLQPKEFSINDINEDLTLALECFKNDEDYNLLIEELKKHELNHSEEYYYEVRDMDHDENFSSLPKHIQAARMIYLNKSCFNGLYRVNSKGYFNVPFGKKKKVVTFSEENFENIKKYFTNTKSIITCKDFEKAVRNAKPGDFVYFDPPYDTLEGKHSFTAYGKDNFTKVDQERLFKVFEELSNRGVYAMVSNHNTPLIQELYKDYNINIVHAKRMINSKGSSRGEIEEVLITNYE